MGGGQNSAPDSLRGLTTTGGVLSKEWYGLSPSLMDLTEETGLEEGENRS